MTHAHSKPRQQAEIAFSKAQSQSLARRQAVDNLSSDVAIRDEKTLRLRAARMAREQEERAATTGASVSTRASRT